MNAISRKSHNGANENKSRQLLLRSRRINASCDVPWFDSFHIHMKVTRIKVLCLSSHRVDDDEDDKEAQFLFHLIV